MGAAELAVGLKERRIYDRRWLGLTICAGLSGLVFLYAHKLAYEAIGRGPFNLENLPVLADADGPFGSPTSDSERSMIGLDATDVLMVIYGFGEAKGLERAMDFAADCLASYCNAEEIETAVMVAGGPA